MCKKILFSMSFVLVLILACNAPGQAVWDNGGEGNLWSVPENWDPDVVPTASDAVQIELEDANCVIDSSVMAECSALTLNSNSSLEMTGGSLAMDGFLSISDDTDSNSLMVMSGGVANMGTLNGTNGRLRVAYRGIGTLIMTGGELNVYDKVEVGRQSGAIGYLYLYDGTINFSGNSSDLEIGTNGTGYVYQYGGVFNVQDNIKLTQNNADAVARLYLYGGVMNAGNLRNPNDMLGDPLMDITEGQLILPGDYRERVNEYINRGWIVAYDGVGILNVTYTADPNQTTITATDLPPELARNPNPRNGATAERTTDGPIISWSPGIYAASHDVYFGTDPNAVRDANNVRDADNIAIWPEFKGNQDPCSFDPGPLDLGQTYYWRIDEVNDADPNSPWKGVVWGFTVADYVVLDDFESYNEIPLGEEGSNLVYMTWTDGYAEPTVNGSTIGYLIGESLETDTVHGGEKSVQIAFNNTTATYSEVTVNIADLGLNSDWAADNLDRLSLWIYGGQLNSTTERMYIKLNGVKAALDAVDITQFGWQPVSIGLENFAGVDLSNVTDLAIGFERTGAFGGTGSILIDDIQALVPSDDEQVL